MTSHNTTPCPSRDKQGQTGKRITLVEEVRITDRLAEQTYRHSRIHMILTLQRLQIFAWMVVVSLSSRGVCAWSTSSWNRRDVLRIGSVASTGILSGSVTVVASAIAADDSPMGRVNELLARLHNVPTFCIVSPEGAAYMVLRKDQAMAVGYAFATFEGALAVLGDAQRNAKEKGYFDTWKDATITTIPMDVAIRLALKKRQRQSQKDQTLDSLLEIIPGAVSAGVQCRVSRF